MTPFIQDIDLLERLNKLGFDAEEMATRYAPDRRDWIIRSTGHTIESVRRWLWEKHGIHFNVFVLLELCTFYCEAVKNDGRCVFSTESSYADPFTAELEGIRKAVEYLEKEKP